mmetsp:Transcript_57231/g.154389  ORF Transcript_57231/g.154389 Transcript_57231/m.154389 type:complete len:280 (+) Transcript_57231:87-926(+)
MLACCCAAVPAARAEVVQTQAVLGREDGPGVALPDSRETSGRQFERMSQKLAGESSESTGERDLNTDVGEPRSRQVTTEEYFPRWNPHRAEVSGDCQIGAGAPWIGFMEHPILCDFQRGIDASPAGWADSPVQASPRLRFWASERDAAQTSEGRLNAQVRIFVGKAQKGMGVHLCDMESLLLSQCLLRIDETATTLTLQTALAREQEFSLKGLKSTLKGEAFKKRVPRLAHATKECLLLVFGEGSEESAHCLVFKDMSDRDEFHTSMKIIQVVASQYTM